VFEEIGLAKSGEIDFDRSMQMIREFAMTTSIYAGHNILTDLRETTIVGETNIGMILKLSLEMVRYWSSFKGRIANVVPDDPNRLLIAKNFEITMQLRGFKYKVFTNFEDAIEWLSEVTEVGEYRQTECLSESSE
jgi:hypothetical protein